jgi:5-methylcytosine-specific restriction endonuclease McrA
MVGSDIIAVGTTLERRADLNTLTCKEASMFEPTVTNQKICRKCRLVVSEFPKERRVCIECVRNERSAYKKLNRQKIIEWRREHDKRFPEKAFERRNGWAKKNPDRVVAICRRTYLKNSEKIKQRVREWRLKNPEKLRLQRLRRNARERKPAGDLTAITNFYQMVGTVKSITCYWCGERVPKKKRQVDHIIPLSKDGPHAVENLCCSCKRCNQMKWAKMPDQFSPQLELFLPRVGVAP